MALQVEEEYKYNTTYYKNGNIYEIYTTKNNLLDGEYKQYYLNNTYKSNPEGIKMRAFYKDGVIQERIVYYKYGNVHYHEFYKNGKLHGNVKEYHKLNDQLYVDLTFVDGKKQGECKIYEEDGSLHKICYYVDDVIIH